MQKCRNFRVWPKLAVAPWLRCARHSTSPFPTADRTPADNSIQVKKFPRLNGFAFTYLWMEPLAVPPLIRS